MIGVEVIFWLAVCVVGYSMVGYPLLLIAVASLRRRSAPPEPLGDDALPRVAIVVAAYNEERHVAERVRNLLALDYPADRYRVYVGSDGSTDSTASILRAMSSPSVQTCEFPTRRGKASVLNDLVARTTEDILVFTDANTSFAPDVLRRLVQPLAAADVGCVSGELRLVASAGDNQDPVYWRYERMLKYNESRIGALLGANGGVYALRRALYRPLPANTIVDDFWISLQALESGYRCLYARDAVAFETVPERIADEFRRRVRIGTGNYQALRRFVGLLLPRHGAVAFAFFSHKVLRWLVPHAMVVALGANALLAGTPFYAALLACQLIFYAGAWVGWLRSRTGPTPRPLRLPYFFVAMNLALLLGWWRYVRGGASGIWARTAR